jgi:hypothetical protein
MDVLLKLKPVFQREFRERFGRELRPDDPVFWSRSRSGEEPVPMTEEEIQEIIDEHMDEQFYAMLAEYEAEREEFLAFVREGERFAGMTKDQFQKLFREKFGREWNDDEPILAARSEEEYQFLVGYIFCGGAGREPLMTEAEAQQLIAEAIRNYSSRQAYVM